MAGMQDILRAADLISDIRKVFGKIENLEKGQKEIAEAISTLDKRLREVEAGLRETRSEAKYEAVKEASNIVTAVQTHLYREIKDLAVDVDRLNRAGEQSTPKPRLPLKRG